MEEIVGNFSNNNNSIYLLVCTGKRDKLFPAKRANYVDLAISKLKTHYPDIKY